MMKQEAMKKALLGATIKDFAHRCISNKEDLIVEKDGKLFRLGFSEDGISVDNCTIKE